MSVMPATTQQRGSFAVRVVERLSGLLARRGTTRRSFLFRAAVVGSAFAVDPIGYALKPGTAYASVCGRSSSCSGGWSVFCCTINGGANTCPDYSYVAGWWKVDASAFCLGAPRYYIDCNRRPNRSCRCRCNTRGGCDRRRTCCNVFRYGQCNTHVKGVTAVVCRIVTCTPPWEWDRSCGRTVRTSESTRTHSSSCLPGTNPSRIEIKYQDLGLVGSFLGAPDGRERDADRNGRKRRYDKGMILWHRDHGAHEVHGWLARRYRRSGAETGPLGYPRTDHRPVGDRSGQIVRFERGSIYRKFGGPTTIVLGRVDRRYRKLGGPRGRLGYPTSDTMPTNARGTATRFERGAIFDSPDTDAVAVLGRIATVYLERGGPGGSGLGFPVAPHRSVDGGGGRKQRFEDGLIIGPSPRRVFVVREPIRRRYMGEMDGPSGPWGYPITHTGEIVDKDGLWNRFQRAVVYWSPQTGSHWFERGTIYRRYRIEGGASGRLGFPIADQDVTPDGLQRVTFEHGAITYEPESGAVEVIEG
ncbi:MAG: hypothetical protein KY460_08590 [Actinobacteria bacterium]|nr:hypothetical protein [Actinomycetota bacterium]